MSGRPTIPPGGHAFASMDAPDGSRWSVRVQMPGEEPTRECRRISPEFVHQTTAYAWLDSITGGAAFVYPAGEA